MSHGGDVNNVGVSGIDSHFANRVRIAQAGVMPRFAFVGGFKNSVARDYVCTDVCLTGADINSLGIRRRYRHRADAGARPRQFSIGDVFPFRTVDALPNAAADRSGIKEIIISPNTGHGDNSAANVRANAAPFELAHQRLRRNRFCTLRSCQRGNECSCDENRKRADFHKQNYLS